MDQFYQHEEHYIRPKESCQKPECIIYQNLGIQERVNWNIDYLMKKFRNNGIQKVADRIKEKERDKQPVGFFDQKLKESAVGFEEHTRNCKVKRHPYHSEDRSMDFGEFTVYDYNKKNTDTFGRINKGDPLFVLS